MAGMTTGNTKISLQRKCLGSFDMVRGVVIVCSVRDRGFLSGSLPMNGGPLRARHLHMLMDAVILISGPESRVDA
jgi:hypothetical protein